MRTLREMVSATRARALPPPLFVMNSDSTGQTQLINRSLNLFANWGELRLKG
jgi:hypothetical protein